MASLEERITQPSGGKSTASLEERITEPNEEKAAADAPSSSSLAPSQVDGAVDDDGAILNESSYDVEVQLSDLQHNTDSPLYSVKTFEELGLPPEINKGLLAMSFRKPSKIQERALPLMLTDPPTNMIAQSQSGTGKTAAFVLTALTRVDLTLAEQPQALILAPSRELARQIQSVVRQIGQFCPTLKVETAVPGSIERGGRVNASVVVGTPGTVVDLIRRRMFDVSQLKLLIIDEADNMLDQQGLGEQCVRVKSVLPKNLQILLFSATFPDKVMQYAHRFAPGAHQMKLKQQELTVKGISQMYIDCSGEEAKYDILCKLYGLMTIGSSVIFVRTKKSADEIQRRMMADGHSVAALHSSFEGADRDAVLESFRNGDAKVLITTNVLARGIDVSTVAMVVNYDIPTTKNSHGQEVPDAETYLHRIGRTGRFGRVGVSISFIWDRESYQALLEIARHYEIDLVRLSTDDWDRTEKSIKDIIKSSRAQPGFNPSADAKC